MRPSSCSKQCGRTTRYGFEQELGRIQLQSNVFRPAERKVRMIISVVPALVPFVDNATNKPLVTLGVHAHEEKRSFCVRRFENVQDLWRPPRIRAVVKSDCDLMFATSALVIQRRELCKLYVLRREITVGVHSELSRTVFAILIDSHNLAIADVRDRVSRFYQFECLSRLIV